MAETAARQYEVRRVGVEEMDRILELVKLSLGEGVIPRSREYWHWKHHANPFGDSPMLLAEADGQLIGLRVFMRWEWVAGGRIFRAVRAVDTATHPDRRGQGIFSKLTRRLVDEMRDEGVHLIFNTPNAQSMPGYLKMGWKSVGRIDMMIRPLAPVRIARALRSGGPADAPDDQAGSSPNPAADVQPASAIFERDDAAAILARTRSDAADMRLRTPLSVPYLKWRYAKIPGFDYFVRWEQRGGGAAAVFFRYKQQGSLTELRITDLLVAPDGVSKRLARGMLRELAADSGADYISAIAAPHLPGRWALMRSGFLPVPRLGPTMTVRLLNDHPYLTDPFRRTTWRLTTGALELF